MSWTQLMEAVQKAAAETSDDGKRCIEIVVCAEGFSVRGVAWVGKYGADDQPLQRASRRQLSWNDFHSNPVALWNAVQVVARSLDSFEAAKEPADG